VLPKSSGWIEIHSGDQHARRLTKLYKKHTISLVYATKSEGTILSPKHMSAIHAVENNLKLYEEWHELCHDSDPPKRHLCAPGYSFANIAFAHPATQGAKTTLYFNGSGKDTLPMELAVSYARDQGSLAYMFPDEKSTAESYEVEGLACVDDDLECAQYEKDGQCQPFADYEMFMRDFCPKTCNLCGPNIAYANASSAGVEVKELVTSIRSNFHFYAYCCESGEATGPGKAAIKEVWDAFVSKLVDDLSALDEANAEDDDNDLRVFYSGDGVETYEALNAVYGDLMWALGSYGFVIVYATLHTRSFFLATVGLFLVMLSIPSALAIFAIFSNSETVSLMSCLSIFIVIGIGSDMLFVYTDFWKQSIQQSRDPVKRLRFTYMQAATSTAATTFTTAMSFLANLASVLRPLREFGFFMGACVVMAWLVMFLGYPPILVIGERCHRRLRRCVNVTEEREKPKLQGIDTVSSFGRKSIRVMNKMLDPEKVGVGEVHKNFLGTRFADFLLDWKCSLTVFFLTLTIGSVIISAQQLEQATGVPQIFPDDHNQVLGKEYRAKFANFEDEVVAALTSVTECDDLFETCNQFKCQSHGRAVGSAFDCKCYPQGEREGFGESPQPCASPAESLVDVRVLGRKGLTQTMVAGADFTSCFKTQYPSASAVSLASASLTSYDILIENWETGKQTLGIVMKPDKVRVTHPGGTAGDVCEEKQICYCGIERCIGGGSDSGYGTLQLQKPGQRRLHAAEQHIGQRRMQEPVPVPAPPVSPENIVDVNVAFGLRVVGSTPLLGVSSEDPYEFDPRFNLQDPWAQRKFESLCARVPTEEVNMKIGSTRCWLLGFRDHWKAQGKDWPLRPTEDINVEVYNYANAHMTDGFQTTMYFWWDGTTIQATYVVFFLSISNLVASSAALEVKDAWEWYFFQFNELAEDSIKGAWHSSKLWVRAEAEKVIINSTLTTLAISLGCVLLGIMAFTFSLHLAVMVMFVVLAIIIGLLFFMVVIMKWPIGAIEVLCLIVFVGFAVDYCLHVAHKYHTCHINQVTDLPPDEVPISAAASNFSSSSHGGRRSSSKRTSSIKIDVGDKPVDLSETANERKKLSSVLLAQNRGEERFARTKYALERMGGAVVGSACTTVGCAAFLLPCQLVIFTKIGAVVMAVTVYAIVYTILPLPSLLMIMGPCGGDMQRLWQYLRKCSSQYTQPKEKKEKTEEKKEDEQVLRRYVLHMPVRGMCAHTPLREKDAGVMATRTRVTATG